MDDDLVMIGAFPPPLHGMAAVNAAVRKSLEEAGEVPRVIDIAAASLDRSFLVRLSRLPRVLSGLTEFLLTRRLRGKQLYMSASGGAGQVYELLYAIIARVRGMHPYLHHHSFAYLDRPRRLTRLLMKAMGKEATHIVLSAGMGERLREFYPSARRVIPVSNAVILLDSDATTFHVRKSLATVGFISNISIEKGVLEFLDLVDGCRGVGLPVRALLAGPFQDKATEATVRGRLSQMSGIEYVGPRYESEKADFYTSIDALVFPTRYPNEAEPLVLHEALRFGIPVLAYGRGAIPEIVGDDCGLVVDLSAPFVTSALGKLTAWHAYPSEFREASCAARSRFEQAFSENSVRWNALMQELLQTSDGLESNRRSNKG